jgi:hypothetical protein
VVGFTCFYIEESLNKNSCCNTPYIHTYFEMTVISFLDFGLGQLSTHIALLHIFFSNIHKEHLPFAGLQHMEQCQVVKCFDPNK